MARRQPITGPDAATAVMVAAAAGMPMPPSHIRIEASDEPFWRSVVAEFPMVEWTDHQLEVAAQLAKAMADLEMERCELRKEGYVLSLGDKMVANPRHGIARDLTNSVMSLRRNLSLHARAKQGEARDIAQRRGVAKAHEAASPLDDDLIARPLVN